MKICGLDVATTTGWAIAEGQSYKTGKWNPGKTEREAQVFARFREWLRTFLLVNEIEFVGIEAPLVSGLSRNEVDADAPIFGQKKRKVPVTSHKTLFRLYALNAIAQEVCEGLSIRFEVIHQGTWRSTFVGRKPKGEDWKKASRRVCDAMGIDAKSDDAAEAAGIAFHCQTKLKVERLQAGAGPLFAEAV
jgi:hypothetical protein